MRSRITQQQPISAEEANQGAEPFLAAWGHIYMQNTYLKTAVLTTGLVAIALAILVFVLVARSAQVERVFIARHADGRVETFITEVDSGPREREIKYFLTQFAVAHYGRMRAKMEEVFPRSLHFLDSSLSENTRSDVAASREIEKVASGESEENDVEVLNVVLKDTRGDEKEAEILMEKIYYSRGNRRVVRRERYVLSLKFVFREPDSDREALINPLGLVITYLHADKFFNSGE